MSNLKVKVIHFVMHLLIASLHGISTRPTYLAFSFLFLFLTNKRYDAYTVVIWTLFSIIYSIISKLTFQDLNI